jgi:hypothetical protein
MKANNQSAAPEITRPVLLTNFPASPQIILSRGVGGYPPSLTDPHLQIFGLEFHRFAIQWQQFGILSDLVASMRGHWDFLRIYSNQTCPTS